MSTSNDGARRSSRNRAPSVRLNQTLGHPSPVVDRTQNARSAKAAKTQPARMQALLHVSLHMTDDEALSASMERNLLLRKSSGGSSGYWCVKGSEAAHGAARLRWQLHRLRTRGDGLCSGHPSRDSAVALINAGHPITGRLPSKGADLAQSACYPARGTFLAHREALLSRGTCDSLTGKLTCTVAFYSLCFTLCLPCLAGLSPFFQNPKIDTHA